MRELWRALTFTVALPYAQLALVLAGVSHALLLWSRAFVRISNSIYNA